MSTQKPINDWEWQVNALIDGELSADQERTLRRTALDQPELQALIERSIALQEGFAHLSPVAVSTEFEERLRAIPGEPPSAVRKPQAANATAMSGVEAVATWLADHIWVRGLSVAVGVTVLGLFITSALQEPTTQRSPSTAEIVRAQEDLDLALRYLAKANQSAHRHLVATVDRQVSHRVRALVVKRSFIKSSRQRLRKE